MSCEGPLLQVHPSHSPTSPLYSPMARSSHLFLPKGRPRANSASGQVLEVPGDNSPSFPLSTPSSPTHPESSLISNSLALPLESNFLRSASLPRGTRAGSAEPMSEDQLSQSVTCRSSMRAALSPRFIRRTATVDTSNMRKEEFEVWCCVFVCFIVV